MTGIKKLIAYWRAMDKNRRKQVLLAIGGAALVLLLAVLPVLAAGKSESDGPKATVLSAAAERADITKEVHAGGTLTEQDSAAIRLPTGVKLTEFYVENYAQVQAGQPLAGVDRVSVMTAISSVQETLDYLKEQLEAADDGTDTLRITAPTPGRVKAVYAKAGDDAAAVMSEHGALAVISLDGLMAVEFETTASLSAGDNVWVGFDDGTDVLGRVESALNGTVVVTVSDEGYPIGARVTITDSDDDRLGSGSLYVHSAWSAAAWSGTVTSVNLTENTDIDSGRTILRLKDVDVSAEFEMLSIQHREYEQLMLELFVMYQSEALLAPCDGVVSGVDKDSIHLLSADGAYSISLLANAPNGDDETAYTNFVGQVAIAGTDSWSVQMNPTPAEATDYLDLSGVDLSTALMTQAANFSVTAPIYELRDGAWAQIGAAEVNAGDILLFAADSTGSCVWMVRVQAAAAEPTPTPEISPTPEQPETSPAPETSPTPDMETEQDRQPSGGMGGMAVMGGGAVQEESFDLFELAGTDILFVTPTDTVTMTVSIDEGDIGSIYVGQTAEVAVDVLKGETREAEVTEVAVTGTSEGGSSKFTAVLTLPRGADMLGGMSATAIFATDTAENALTVPTAALDETEAGTVVYTKRSGDALSGAVTVTTGASDGERTEILSGLTEGATVYYSYYEAQELDNSAG